MRKRAFDFRANLQYTERPPEASKLKAVHLWQTSNKSAAQIEHELLPHCGYRTRSEAETDVFCTGEGGEHE